MNSPYEGLSIDRWQEKTFELLDQHPLNPNTLCEVVLRVWDDLFHSQIGSKPYEIGLDLFPKPQIMGFFLHELIPLELEQQFPDFWRRDQTSSEKDIVYIPDSKYSIEIKTSSSGRNIYGNRSYAQKGKTVKKSKSGYYLAINFEKFSAKVKRPQITQVRFGWLDHEDWLGQVAATGQQARLSVDVERYKLITLPIRK